MSAQKDTDLIIFDLDGTLVDSKRDIARAMNFTLEEIGLDTRNEDEISGFIGYGLKGLIERSLGSDNMHLFDKTLDIYQKKYQKHMLDTSKLFPNVKEVLEHFKNKTKAIVTNKRGDISREQLENLGIIKAVILMGQRQFQSIGQLRELRP